MHKIFWFISAVTLPRSGFERAREKPIMQIRTTARLSRILASAVKKSSFRQAAIDHNIFTADGRPDPGMVKHLINGYEPRRPETRARLGLPAVCPQCNRRYQPAHLKSEPVMKEESFDPTAPRTKFVSPEDPVRQPLSGYFRSVITGMVVNARQWFQEKATLA
jgi:hypothetical protein